MAPISGRILTPQGWIEGAVSVEGSRIVGICHGDALDHLVVPGFIDLHCHGAEGSDFMDAGDASRRIARLHARHGTTSMLATTMTAPRDEIVDAVDAATAAIRTRNGGEARILGIHLEGPFISPDRLGAQPPDAILADTEFVRRLMELAPLSVLTWAPEADPEYALLDFLTRVGVRVQIGHSSSTYETTAAAFARGVGGVTHLFNAMTPLQHRAPGIVGAALAHAEHAEVIPDLLHVHPGALRVALRAIPATYAVTDASAATALPDGEHQLILGNVRKCEHGVRLADGTLAGSCLTMDVAFRNLVAIGLDFADASRRTSTLAADYLGLTDRGQIREGSFADLVVLDRDLAVIEVYVEGERISLD